MGVDPDIHFSRDMVIDPAELSPLNCLLPRLRKLGYQYICILRTLSNSRSKIACCSGLDSFHMCLFLTAESAWTLANNGMYSGSFNKVAWMKEEKWRKRGDGTCTTNKSHGIGEKAKGQASLLRHVTPSVCPAVRRTRGERGVLSKFAA